MADAQQHLNLLYQTFPTAIAPATGHKKIFWLLKVGGAQISVKFFCPHFPSSEGLKVYEGPDVLQFIEENSETFREYCGDASTVLSFMIQFEKFFRSLLGEAEGAGGNFDLEMTGLVLGELSNIGWAHVLHLSRDLDQVQLGYTDENGDCHQLDIRIPKDYPLLAPVASCCLPGNWAPGGKRLADLYTSWRSAIDAHLPAWAALKELDRVCWVLDPDPPTTAHLYRRIALAPSLSLHLQICPSSVSALPDLKFFGPDHKTLPLRRKLSENLELWDESDPVLINLERVLDVEFPVRQSCLREDLQVDCGICYSYNLEGDWPAILCSSPRCTSSFHACCLYEWLKSLPDTRSTLDTLFGCCPYCRSPLSCQRPSRTS